MKANTNNQSKKNTVEVLEGSSNNVNDVDMMSDGDYQIEKQTTNGGRRSQNRSRSRSRQS
jgi:hypothetical protein